MNIIVVGAWKRRWEFARGIHDVELIAGYEESHDNLDLQLRRFHSRARMATWACGVSIIPMNFIRAWGLPAPHPTNE